jgi:lipopolysaccharide export system permease protein
MSGYLKTIDRYILKRFLGTYLFSNILIISIIVIFDISEKIDNFIYASMKEVIVDHYLNFIPYFLNRLSPMFTFIAVIFFTSRLAAKYETVAILSSGASYRRFLRPYMIGSALIALVSLLISHFIIPQSNRVRQAFEDKYINNTFQNKEINIHRQIEKGTLIYMETYQNNTAQGFKFSLEKTKNGKLQYMLSADEIAWDSIKQVWKIKNYYERFVPENKDFLKAQLAVGDKSEYKEKLVFGTEKDLKIDFYPKDMGRVESKVEVMTYPELKKFIASEKEKGSNGIERFEVENYNRTAVPFSTFILTIIGVCLSSRKIRGGIGMHLALGLLLAASYQLFLQVSSIFAINGLLPPFIAVWTPNIIYGAIAFYLYRTAQK